MSVYFYNHNDVRIRNACYWDVTRMQHKLRESDRLEVAASHGHSGPQALMYSFSASGFCACVLYKTEPVAMFGVVPDEKMEHVGTAWLLATDDVRKIYLTFLKLTRSSIRQMQLFRPVLYNYVDNRNETAIRWLTWAGATISDPKPYGILGLKFRFFTFEKKPAAVNGGKDHL